MYSSSLTQIALHASVLLNSINVNFVNTLHFYYGVSGSGGKVVLSSEVWLEGFAQTVTYSCFLCCRQFVQKLD